MPELHNEAFQNAIFACGLAANTLITPLEHNDVTTDKNAIIQAVIRFIFCFIFSLPP